MCLVSRGCSKQQQSGSTALACKLHQPCVVSQPRAIVIEQPANAQQRQKSSQPAPACGTHQRLRSPRQRLDRKWISMLGVAHTCSVCCACSSCSWRAVPAGGGTGRAAHGKGSATAAARARLPRPSSTRRGSGQLLHVPASRTADGRSVTGQQPLNLDECMHAVSWGSGSRLTQECHRSQPQHDVQPAHGWNAKGRFRLLWRKYAAALHMLECQQFMTQAGRLAASGERCQQSTSCSRGMAHSLKRPTMGRSKTFCTNSTIPCLTFLLCSSIERLCEGMESTQQRAVPCHPGLLPCCTRTWAAAARAEQTGSAGAAGPSWPPAARPSWCWMQ